jgi:hypothetical protein
MFSTPLAYTSFPSSMAMTHRFGFLMMFKMSWMFSPYFLLLSLSYLTVLPCLQALVFCLWFGSVQAFNWVFIWLTKTFVSRISVWIFQEFCIFIEFLFQYPTLSFLFCSTVCILLEFIQLFICIVFDFIQMFIMFFWVLCLGFHLLYLFLVSITVRLLTFESVTLSCF